MFEVIPDCGGPMFDHSRFDYRRCPGCQGWKAGGHHFQCPLVTRGDEDISHLSNEDLRKRLPVQPDGNEQ